MNTQRLAVVRICSALFHDWWNMGKSRGFAVAERRDSCAQHNAFAGHSTCSFALAGDFGAMHRHSSLLRIWSAMRRDSCGLNQ